MQRAHPSDFFIKKFYYPHDVIAGGHYSVGGKTDQRYRPAIGIYIKFTITDPKYPDNASRERVIFKVVDTELRGGMEDPGKGGCPVITYN